MTTMVTMVRAKENVEDGEVDEVRGGTVALDSNNNNKSNRNNNNVDDGKVDDVRGGTVDNNRPWQESQPAPLHLSADYTMTYT